MTVRTWCRRHSVLAILLQLFFAFALSPAVSAQSIYPNGSFETLVDPNAQGLAFEGWGGWVWNEGRFEVGHMARTGSHSALLRATGPSPTLRLWYWGDVTPGRYRITAYIAGYNITPDVYGRATEFAFMDKYMQLGKAGTFGWTKLTYVGDVTQLTTYHPAAFGLMGAGLLWVDDVTVELVDQSVPLTNTPVLGESLPPAFDTSSISPIGNYCPICGAANHEGAASCRVCGEPLEQKDCRNAPERRLLTSFESGSPFSRGEVVNDYATDGVKSLKLQAEGSGWWGAQDWSCANYLTFDVYSANTESTSFYLQLQDNKTTGYWTRVNYYSAVPPGRSTFTVTLDQLYVGEKSRPGRKVDLSNITAFWIETGGTGPIYVDNIRLERDASVANVQFPGLYAFDFGPAEGPGMPGFLKVDGSRSYAPARGYGFQGSGPDKPLSIWRQYDVLQPDPLYQDFLCMQQGEFSVDVPNGKWRVYLNIDNPSGYWGEFQERPSRKVFAEGLTVVSETETFEQFKNRYFRFWNTEDVPQETTFDKYQEPYYDEKSFDVDVSDGRLNIGFEGTAFANSLSTVILYPVSESARGSQFLNWVKEKRRFFFDNYFKRILHTPEGDAIAPTAADVARGYIQFVRDPMREVYPNDTPFRSEIGKPMKASGFAGEYEHVTVEIYPLKDLGIVSARASDLTGPAVIPGSRVVVGPVSNRVTRISADGSTYTIAPRYIMPSNSISVKNGNARRFSLTVKIPPDARPGGYRGAVTITAEHGEPLAVPLILMVRPGALAELDIPAGPWGHNMQMTTWLYPTEGAEWKAMMRSKSLDLIREYGFTTTSEAPSIQYLGFENGVPKFDFSDADAQMALLRQKGFTMPINSYLSGVGGYNAYYKDTAAMQAAGFSDYSQFIKAMYSAIQQHAVQKNWLPVYYNLADEPLGDDVPRAVDNAAAYRAAFPSGPPYFTGAFSIDQASEDNLHFQLGRNLHLANLNYHNEDVVRLLQQHGTDWGLYNGGNRWNYGVYLYKAAKRFGLKYRVTWYWNIVAGDPFYALDTREDDTAFAVATPDNTLMRTLYMERLREGLDDYRYLLTLQKLADAKNDAPAKEAISRRLDAFRIRTEDFYRSDDLYDWAAFKEEIGGHIARLSGGDVPVDPSSLRLAR